MGTIKRTIGFDGAEMNDDSDSKPGSEYKELIGKRVTIITKEFGQLEAMLNEVSEYGVLVTQDQKGVVKKPIYIAMDQIEVINPYGIIY
jgi:hypothetical protein